MNKNWPHKPLGLLCDVLDHKRKPITKRDRTAGQFPYYGATGVLDFIHDYIFDEPLVLVGEDGAKWASGENTAFRAEGKYWVNNHAHVLRPHRNLILDTWLINYLNHSDLSDFVSGLTVPKLNQANLREIVIPLPPLDEQQRIVAILDKAFENIDRAKANTEKNLQNARAVFESQLNLALQRKNGWTQTTLSKVLTEQPRNGWSPPAANHSDIGTPVLTLSSVTGFQFRPDKIKFTSAKTNSSRHYWVKDGDFLITRSNTPELVGHVAIVEKLTTPTIYPDLIMRMSPAESCILTKFLYYQMRSSSLRTEITSRAQGANPTMKKLSKGAVQSLPIVVPSLSEQTEIISQLDSLYTESQRLESIYQRKLNALEELKKSLLAQAFNGEL